MARQRSWTSWSAGLSDNASSHICVGYWRYHGFFDNGYHGTGCGNDLGYGAIGCTGDGIFGVGQHSGISSVLDYAVNCYGNGIGIFGSSGYGVLGSGHGIGTGTFRPSETAR